MEELVFPKQIKVEELTDTSGRLIIEPLEQGFGTTLGNSLRRVLLSAIPGAAVVRVRFAGKYHEYDTIEGVKEDVLEIILNLKGISFRLHDGEMKRLNLEKKGPGEVTAADITLQPGIEVINPDHHIATLNAKGALDLEMEVEAGFGYVPAELNRLEDSPLSVIPIDADFSPVKKVNFVIEETRVGGKSGYERLIIELETDGGIRPEEAISEASAEEEEGPEEGELSIPLTELKIDQRACNLLHEADITTLAELLSHPREELLDIHGFGAKTLSKVEERLAELGYTLKSEGEMRSET